MWHCEDAVNEGKSFEREKKRKKDKRGVYLVGIGFPTEE